MLKITKLYIENDNNIIMVHAEYWVVTLQYHI